MAIDTRSKRASALGFLNPALLALPLPDGTINQGDRQHLVRLYSGIAVPADLSVALTGVSSTASAGALAVAVSRPLIGVSTTLSAGIIIATVDVSVALTGISSTASAGVLAVTVARPIAGVESPLSAGAVTATMGQSVALTGVSSSASAGSFAVAASVPVTGASTTLSAGAITGGGLDTVSKRASAMAFLKPWTTVLPVPDTTIDQGDRQHVGMAYSGVLASELTSEVLPLRGIFYYPWFTNGSAPYWGAWTQQSIAPYTQYQPKYRPGGNYYNSDDQATMDNHIDAMEYANCDVVIWSWWGQGSREDDNLDEFLARLEALSSPLKVAIYYEAEGNTVAGQTGSPDPTSAFITGDLDYLSATYTNHPNYLRIGGEPVVFAYGGGEDGGQAVGERPAARWAVANAAADQTWYTVLKVYTNYALEADQPSSWHQYGPATAVDVQGAYSYTISPGYWYVTSPEGGGGADGQPWLVRDLGAWATNVAAMHAASVDWKLVTTFNEFGEGSVVEAVDGNTGRTPSGYTGSGWDSASGYGDYLDLLHTDGVTDNVTVALTGVSSALSAGSLAAARSAALTGTASTASPGTVVPARSAPLVGATGTGAVGTLAPSRAIALVGSAGSFSAGALVPARAVPLAGIGSTASAGSVTYSAGADLSVALAGASSTVEVTVGGFDSGFDSGFETASGVVANRGLALTGVAVTASAGSVSYSAAGNVTVALTGIASTVAAGSLVRTSVVAVSGIASAVSAGAMVASRVVSVSGVGVTAAGGALTAARAVSVASAASTVSAGIVTTAADVTVVLTGLVSTLHAGAIASARTAPVSGGVSVLAVGTLAAGKTVVLVGVVGMASPGAISPRWSVVLVGISRTLSAGAVVVVGPVVFIGPLVGRGRYTTHVGGRGRYTVRVGGQARYTTHVDGQGRYTTRHIGTGRYTTKVVARAVLGTVV